jgi:putative acetyltransferase
MATITTPARHLQIRCESPDQPGVRRLLHALDAYLAGLYEPEQNHILDLPSLLSPTVCFLVARRGEQIVGCGAYRRMPGEAATDGRPYGEIKRMMVDPAARGEGIGSALLQALEQRLRDEGLDLALLETGSAQREAVALYRRSGYVERLAFAGYPDNGLSLFLHKRLRP